MATVTELARCTQCDQFHLRVNDLESAGPDAFQQLVSSVSAALESSSGQTIADVDASVIEGMMKLYTSKKSEWQKYAFSDPSRGYTRNLVDAGKGKCNLLVLVWTPGKGSPVHDHANAHCVMKILQGTLQETLYDWPDASAVAQGKDTPLPITRQRQYQENEVTYMSDQLGLHRISNPDPKEVAVSLHLYTPPNAARHGCSIFDEKTGAQSHVQQCHFYSEYGQRMQN